MYGYLVADIHGAKYPIIIHSSEYNDENNIDIDYDFIIPETVSQYTGLSDKYGKRIFEGDIVKFKTTLYDFKKCKVEYQDYYAGYYAVDNKGYEYSMGKFFEYEVIGNIYDNPELLRSDTK